MEARYSILQKRLCLLALLLWLPLGSFAQENQPAPVLLEQVGLRFYPTRGQLCITQDSLSTEALALLGTDEATVLASLRSQGIVLICFTPTGEQVSLHITDKPYQVSAQSSYQLTSQEDRAAFVSLLAQAQGYAAGRWADAMPGYVFFSQPLANTAPDGLSLTTLSLSTLYLNRIYSFQMDIIGRQPTPGDEALLCQMAGQAIQLGSVPEDTEAGEGAPLLLPSEPILSTQNAAIALSQEGTLSLQLSSIPSVIGVTSWAVSGTTAANALLRYTVNGISSSRIRTEADGSFSVTMKELLPEEKNEIEFTVTDGQHTTTARFSIEVSWLYTPLALSKTTGAIAGDAYLLHGKTLPGAKVQAVRGQNATPLSVNKDGSFTHSIKLKATGETSITIRALAPGYHRTDQTVTLSHALRGQEELASLQKGAARLEDMLLDAPFAHKGSVILGEGQITALANIEGQPCFLLTLADGQKVLFRCADLLTLHLGQQLRLLGTLEGETQRISTPWESGVFPVATLLSQIN